MNEMTEKQMIYETYINMDVIKKRVDKHSIDNHERFITIENKLDTIKDDISYNKEELLKKVQEVELRQVQDDKNTNTKLGVLSGVISVIVSFITSIVGLKVGTK